MVDRPARAKAAQLLRHFACGRITNYQFEQRWPDSTDPVLFAIASSIWCLYDDFHEHRLNGSYALTPPLKRTLARWVVFLYSDTPYQWPPISLPGLRPLHRNWLSRRLGLSKLLARREQHFMNAGVYSVWPFADIESFGQALATPTLLAHASSHVEPITAP